MLPHQRKSFLQKISREQYILHCSSALSGLNLQIFFQKFFFNFFIKNLLWKGFLYFLKKTSNFVETKTLKKSLYFRKQNFLIFRKRNFLIFRERYVQNYDIFRTRDVFKTTAYLEPEAYSEHCQTSKIERFAKIAT